MGLTQEASTSPTLRLRRSADRGFEDFGWTDNWITFSFGYQQLKVTDAERQGRFRLYVSLDAHDGSMPINADARIYAGLFRPGDRIEHALTAGRGAWVSFLQREAQV